MPGKTDTSTSSITRGEIVVSTYLNSEPLHSLIRSCRKKEEQKSVIVQQTLALNLLKFNYYILYFFYLSTFDLSKFFDLSKILLFQNERIG